MTHGVTTEAMTARDVAFITAVAGVANAGLALDVAHKALITPAEPSYIRTRYIAWEAAETALYAAVAHLRTFLVPLPTPPEPLS
ncbi:MAG: hypothetical protein WCG26_03025 [Chloroflexales bacterium]